MAFSVNDACIGCGLCTSVAPGVFELTDSGKAAVLAQPTDPTQAREAKDQCPVGAIQEN